MTAPLPFWKAKPLEALSATEWESLCDGCGRCCLFRVRSGDSDVQHHTDIACRLLNHDTGRCGDYANRTKVVSFCGTFSPQVVRGLGWLPATCGYRLVAEGRDLDWWHPLVSGDPDTVRQAGISVRGRAIHEAKAGKLEYHAVNWPAVPTAADGTLPMRWRALFGGVTADLLTPLRPDLSIDLDRMAAHALRVLELGGDGLRLLGAAGEGETFNAEERIAALTGLVERGVPASKLLPDVRGRGEAEVLRLARHAADLGCRGAILPADAVPRSMEAFRPFAERAREIIPLYLETVADPRLGDSLPWHALSSRDTLLQGLLATGPAAATLAARASAEGLEVLGDDATDLSALLTAGGAGCVSAIANIAGRLPAYVCRHWEQPGAAVARSVMASINLCLGAAPRIPGLKALLARQTGDPAWLAIRPPRVPLSGPQRASLEAAYDRARAKPSS